MHTTSRLNRTRVELKRHNCAVRAASAAGLNRTRVELKRHAPERIDAWSSAVWIEPEWNWNEHFAAKRDIVYPVWIEPEWNWNMKKVSFSALSPTVWIEPEWNWNTCTARQSRVRKTSLNRTRVELKRAKRVDAKDGNNRVWIEPEWNWNSSEELLTLSNIHVWIEPEWNWNQTDTNLARLRYFEFESNQSGIETLPTQCWSLCAGHRLNRTRVELKPLARAAWAHQFFGLNRTRVELKHYVYFSTRRLLVSLNRTRVELKQIVQICKKIITWGLNRTRVELKPELVELSELERVRFESNQSGIETDIFEECIDNFIRLNRTRVELKLYCSMPSARPMALSLNRTRVELKPIQDGRLSRVAFVWIEPEWNWNSGRIWLVPCGAPCLNRTRVELKPPPIWIKPIAQLTVWIEPEWNWNLLWDPGDTRFQLRLNRTRVELKRLWYVCSIPTKHKFESNQSGIETDNTEDKIEAMRLVWIEPEWNWNHDVQIRPTKEYPFESNQSGIETLMEQLQAVLLWLFESNQSGIETRLLRFIVFHWRIVWIEPEWNWNRNWRNSLKFLKWFESNQSGIETKIS